MAKLTPEACRAARALLGWGVRDLAREAGVGFQTVARFETGRADMRQTTAAKILARLELEGVEITNGDGTGARLLSKPDRH